jgi:hypothetical protein
MTSKGYISPVMTVELLEAKGDTKKLEANW